MNAVPSKLALVALLLCSCAAARCRSEGPREMSNDLANHKPIAALITKADKLVLYEGLPHQVWEGDLLVSEKATKKTVTLHEFPFYAEAIAPQDDAAKALTAIVSDAKSLKQYTGGKRCGGFHPDWCLEWHVGDEKVQCLVCFGCHEVKFFAPKQTLHADLSNDALGQLETALKKYQNQRPRHRRGQ